MDEPNTAIEFEGRNGNPRWTSLLFGVWIFDAFLQRMGPHKTSRIPFDNPDLAKQPLAIYFPRSEIRRFSMKKRVLYGLLFVVLGLNLYIGAEIYFTSAQAAEKNNLYQQMDVFVRVMEKVRQEYVDGDKVSYDELMRGALKGMLG